MTVALTVVVLFLTGVYLVYCVLLSAYVSRRYSLSYHYGFCPEHKSDAFKFDILSADQALSKGGRVEALVYMREATIHVNGLGLREWQMHHIVVEFLLELMDPGNTASFPRRRSSVGAALLSWIGAPKPMPVAPSSPRDQIQFNNEKIEIKDMVLVLRKMKFDAEFVIASLIKTAKASGTSPEDIVPLTWKPPHVCSTLIAGRKAAEKEHISAPPSSGFRSLFSGGPTKRRESIYRESPYASSLLELGATGGLGECEDEDEGEDELKIAERDENAEAAA